MSGGGTGVRNAGVSSATVGSSMLVRDGTVLESRDEMGVSKEIVRKTLDVL